MNKKWLGPKIPMWVLIVAVWASGLLFPNLHRALAQNRVRMTLSPAELTVQPGETFVVDVVIESDVPLRGAQCALAFDSSLLEVLSVEEGEFFKEWAQQHTSPNIQVETLQFPSPRFNNEKGYVNDLAVVVMGQVPGGNTGQGVFLRYQMRARSDVKGAATVMLVYPLAVDERAQEIWDVQVSNGLVLVGEGPFPTPRALEPPPPPETNVQIARVETLADPPDSDVPVERPGVRWGQMMGFTVSGLLLVAAAIFWWLSRRQ